MDLRLVLGGKETRTKSPITQTRIRDVNIIAPPLYALRKPLCCCSEKNDIESLETSGRLVVELDVGSFSKGVSNLTNAIHQILIFMVS